MINPTEVVFVEVVRLPTLDVVPVNGDVVVPVCSALLVPEAGGMQQLVYHNP